MTDQVSDDIQSGSNKTPSLLKYRIKFIALISVFLLPFIAGWFAFYVFDYRPVSKNYGDLVQPVRPLAIPVLVDINGVQKKSEFWNKWTFVILQNNTCQKLCKDNLYYLRQMRIALGRDYDRVQNVLMLGNVPGDHFSRFLQEYPDLTVFSQVEQEVFQQFDLIGVQTGASAMLYLMDPNGNLMMTYSAVNDPSSILSDMRRLLKLSQIG